MGLPAPSASTASSSSSDLDLEPDCQTSPSSSMTDLQNDALNELRELCKRENVFWKTAKSEGREVEPSNDDETLLRYLRARSYLVPAAFKQYNATIAWRRKLQLDEMYRTVDIGLFEAIRRLMPQWTGRRSRNGVPIFVYSIAKTRPEDLLATTKLDPSLSSVFLPAEFCTQFVQPFCSRIHHSGVISCSAFIVNLDGVGIKHFWNLRALMQKLSTMATSHYPESVDKIFILGAPSFFPTIMGYINRWFDPVITSKISIPAPQEAKTALLKYIKEEDLPASFGGSLDWEYGMHPALDTEAMSLAGQLAGEWVEGPLKCTTQADGGNVIEALGANSRISRPQVLTRFAPAQVTSDGGDALA